MVEVLQKATVYDGKEKNTNRKVNEVNKKVSVPDLYARLKYFWILNTGKTGNAVGERSEYL